MISLAACALVPHRRNLRFVAVSLAFYRFPRAFRTYFDASPIRVADAHPMTARTR